MALTCSLFRAHSRNRTIFENRPATWVEIETFSQAAVPI